MSKHIKFDGFECDNLAYVKGGDCWVCLKLFCELDDVEFCFRCKFERQLRKERLMRKVGASQNGCFE